MKNALIGKFMGIQHPTMHHLFLHPTGGWVTADNLEYHRSWNGVMSVVEYIQALNPHVRFVLDGSKCKIVLSKKQIKVHTLKPINSVYQAVLQFIEYYHAEQIRINDIA